MTTPIALPWIGEFKSEWRVVPNKAIIKPKKQSVGVSAHQYDLLSLTKQGVVIRNLDEGGKFPENFDSYQRVEPGDLITCLFDVEETPRTIGISNYSGMITGAYDVFEFKGDINPRFFEYYYLALDQRKGLKYFYSGLRNVIRTPVFLSIPMPLPPRAEQDAIAHFLNVEISRIDNLITIQNSFRTLLAERDHSIRQQLIESAWPLVRFGRVVNQVLGNGDAETGVSLDAIESWTGHIVSENLQTNVSGTLFRAGDVLFGRLRPYLAKSSVPEFEGAALGDVLVFRSDLVEASFLSLLMRTRSFIEHCTGASYGTKMPRVNWDTIREFEFPLPPREVQIEIVEKVSLELARSELLRSKSLSLSDLLTNRKTSLIANVVTGKLELQGETDG